MFLEGKYIAGGGEIMAMQQSGKLSQILQQTGAVHTGYWSRVLRISKILSRWCGNLLRLAVSV